MAFNKYDSQLSIGQQENVDNMRKAFNLKTRKLKAGESCSVGCERHVTHRCEKCGRYAANRETTIFEPKD